MNEEPVACPLTDREDRLRLIIQHSLTETIRNEMHDIVTVPTCKLIHENLERERKQRGDEIEKRINCDTLWREKIEKKFDKFYIAVIVTLASSLGALILAGINFIVGKVK